MRMTPESRLLDDPVLIADRVRNSRYEPAKYNNTSDELNDRDFEEVKVNQGANNVQKRNEPSPKKNSSFKDKHEGQQLNYDNQKG